MKIEVKIIHTLDDNTLLLGINKRTTLINKIIDFIRGQDEETIIANHNRRHYMISLGTCITSTLTIFITLVSPFKLIYLYC